MEKTCEAFLIAFFVLSGLCSMLALTVILSSIAALAHAGEAMRKLYE